MPTEKRKIQNRVNQRRYRMQMKHRIETLERILNARSAAGPRNNSADPGSDRNSTLERANEDHFGGHPVPSDNSNASISCSSDYDPIGNSEGFDVTQLPFPPWLQSGQIPNDTCTDINLLNQNKPVAEIVGSDDSMTMNVNQDLILPTTKEQRSNEIINYLREENKFLKDAVLELSKALANMYCTAKTESSKKDVTCTPQTSSARNHFPLDTSPHVTSDSTPLEASSHASQLHPRDIENLLLPEDPSITATETPNYFQFSDSAPTLPYGNSLDLTTHQTPVFNTLPLPISYAYTSPTFSLRLARAVYECGYSMLTSGHFSPADVERVFGFFLKFSSRIALLEKIGTYLGVSRLGFSNGQITQQPNEQTWHNVPDLRDYANEWGEWIEVDRVEGYLQSLGWSIDGWEGYGRCVSLVRDGGELGGGGLERDEQQGELSMNEQLTWGSFDCGGNEFETLGDGFEDCSIAKVQLSVHAEDGLHTSNGYGMSLSSNHQQDLLYLDVDRFTTSLIDRTICLGRTAGFRRWEVDEVLNKCLVKG